MSKQALISCLSYSRLERGLVKKVPRRVVQPLSQGLEVRSSERADAQDVPAISGQIGRRLSLEAFAWACTRWTDRYIAATSSRRLVSPAMRLLSLMSSAPMMKSVGAWVSSLPQEVRVDEVPIEDAHGETGPVLLPLDVQHFLPHAEMCPGAVGRSAHLLTIE